MHNEEKLSSLLKEIDTNIEALNIRDAEGHIWWGKFRDMVHKYVTICPACDGSGSFIDDEDYEQWCCGKPNPDGSCCGNGVPTPVLTQKACSYCGGYGTVPENHLEL